MSNFSSAKSSSAISEADGEYANVIIPAKIEWQIDDTGNQVPVSGEFGDVYFSHADGLAESRHVFLDGNQLTERLANLLPEQCFTIAELGFGTALNVLAVWQLWRQLRVMHPHLATARLHIITTEKHPIPIDDLTNILSLWSQRAPELGDIIEQLLAVYPPLIAGAHRLNFTTDYLILDIWFGDAADSLTKLSICSYSSKQPKIDAWFLDGFAPSCNESLWAHTIFAQIQRLSHLGTSAATYSCAGVVKRGLQSAGFEIKKVQGFGRKRHMLSAVMTEDTRASHNDTGVLRSSDVIDEDILSNTISQPRHTIVIGAGVSGLMMAWSLANRSIKVTLLDKIAPLAGASGNPRALLAPKMTPIHHVDEHLHTIGYLYSGRLYRQLNKIAIQMNTAPILEPTGALDLLIKANIDSTQIADYPDEMATILSASDAQEMTNLVRQDLSEHLYLPQSGLVNPQALKDVILQHPLITFKALEVSQIQETKTHVCIGGHSISENANEVVIEGDRGSIKTITIEADNVVICAAYESHYIDKRIFDCRKIRGQLSWFTPTSEQWANLPSLPLKYSGYCAPFTAQVGDAQLNDVVEGQQQLLLGASFVRNDTSVEGRSHEHQESRDKLMKAIPELADIVPTDTRLWQARAGVRTQTPDYHPIVGQLAHSKRIWTLSAMGSKGYAFAPLCAETLADIMLGNFTPLSMTMLARLSPKRPRLQTPLV